jgi:hypothetical protein
MGRARDIPFAGKTSQTSDFYMKLKFCMGRFTHEYRVLSVKKMEDRTYNFYRGNFPHGSEMSEPT